MILYIVRHAWAEEPGNPAWSEDAQRPLAREGQERFARVVKTLAERGFAPQRIATSPLIRCWQTAEIVAKHVEHKPEIIERGDLSAHERRVERAAAVGVLDSVQVCRRLVLHAGWKMYPADETNGA